MPLTETHIKALKPGKKETKVADAGGLYLAVHPNGSKYWRLKYRFAGKEKKLAIEKAKIDYFQPFLMLWMHFNFWMQANYKNEVTQTKSDRPLITKVKTDTINNPIYNRFKILFREHNTNKDAIQFRSDLEALHYALENAEMRYATQVGAKTKYYPFISFNSLLIDHDKKKNESAYEKMLIRQIAKDDEERPPESNLLSTWYVRDEPERFFAGLIEAIYAVRCDLVHGSLRSSPEVHEVIKYCYFLLYNLHE